MNEAAQAGLCVQFDEDSIVAYGGTGVGIHSDLEAAREAGFDSLVSWGTLTMLPFWELLDGVDAMRGRPRVELKVELRKPVLAGDRVRYTMREMTDTAGRPIVELVATTERFGTVATAIASAPDREAA